jgi:hypothetical protein
MKDQLATMGQEQILELTDKEREMYQSLIKLEKEMHNKITETKANLMALSEEQMATTTRLKVLQNHQLNDELSNQSKQTEDMLKKNDKLREAMTKLQREIDVHKEVEQKLAKRSHYFQ